MIKDITWQFALLNVTEDLRAACSISYATEDIPDCYHRLLLPGHFGLFFGLDDVSFTQLADLCQREVFVITFDEPALLLSIISTLMGWSWAAHLAQTCLEGTLIGAGGWIRREAHLAHGCPIPQGSGAQPVHWKYIDDFGVMVVQEPRKEASQGLEHLRTA